MVEALYVKSVNDLSEWYTGVIYVDRIAELQDLVSHHQTFKLLGRIHTRLRTNTTSVTVTVFLPQFSDRH